MSTVNDLAGFIPRSLAIESDKYLIPDPSGKNLNPCVQTFSDNDSFITMIQNTYGFPHKRVLAIFTQKKQFFAFPGDQKTIGNCIIIPITDDKDVSIHAKIKRDFDKGTYANVSCVVSNIMNVKTTYVVDKSVLNPPAPLFVEPPGILSKEVLAVCPHKSKKGADIVLILIVLIMFLLITRYV